MRVFHSIFFLLPLSLYAQLPDREITFPKDKETKLGRPYAKNYDTTNSYFFIDDFYYFGDPFIESYPIGALEVSLRNFHLLSHYFRWKPDSSHVEWLTKKLKLANEPVLKNEYMGNDTYRFLWHRSFHPDYIFTFYNHADSALLTIKKFIGDSVERTSLTFPAKDFQEFQSLVNQSNFWIQKTYDPAIWTVGSDGAQWVFEAHTEWTYKIMNRWAPKLIKEDEYIIRLLGQWLINKSKIEVELIY